ncbi:hypothetical protein ADL07_31030 [Streptomyces sp. NRRL F-4707]|nr:hypothetical protein ADL07_31030 [Streptomyces sp. NRRL F-4707]
MLHVAALRRVFPARVNMVPGKNPAEAEKRRVVPTMEAINETHLSEPGLIVLDTTSTCASPWPASRMMRPGRDWGSAITLQTGPCRA